MSAILIDTSVWIEYFSLKSRLSPSTLEKLSNAIIEDEIVIVDPIRAELLSGQIRASKRAELEALFSALKKIDLDWNSKENWDQVIALAGVAMTNRIPVPGLVDRMILLSAQKAGAVLYTLDKGLLKLSKYVDLPSLDFF